MSTIEYPPVAGPNWRAIWGVIRKDLRVVLQSKGVVLPGILIPTLLVVLLPGIMAFMLNFFSNYMQDSGELGEVLAIVPAELLGAGVDPLEVATLFVLRSFFAPLYLIVPIMIASVVAADAFAGERERKTLEALLYTPTSDLDLLLAKFLGALIPAVAVAWGSAVLYWLVVDLATWSLFQRPILPDLNWLLLALWVAPGAAAMGLGATVLVSSRAKSMQDAYQISGLLVMPAILLMIGQSVGVLFLGPTVLLLAGLVFYAVAAVLVAIGARVMRRQEMIARL